jgi:hypothetical protein
LSGFITFKQFIPVLLIMFGLIVLTQTCISVTPSMMPRVTVGHAVAQLVEAMRYNPEGRGFDSRWRRWNFSLTYTLRLHYGPGIDSGSNRSEYQEYLLGEG